MNLDGLKSIIKLNEQLNLVDNNLQELKGPLSYLEGLVERIETSKSEFEKFGFFDKIFRRSEFVSARDNYNSLISENSNAAEEKKEAKETISKLLEDRDNLLEDINFIAQNFNINEKVIENISMFSINENGQVVFDLKDVKNIALQKIDSESLTKEDRVLIHKTNFFPKDNKILTSFDGKKIETENANLSNVYMFSFKCSVASCRHTSHYTLNHGVSSHPFGNWDSCNVVVLEDFANHENEFVEIEATDSYTRNSLNLSDQSLKLISREYYDILTDSEKQSTNIVILDNINSEMQGKDVDKAISVMLQACGKPSINPPLHNSSSHSLSNDNKYEAVWEPSTKILDFLKNDKNVFDDNFTLSGEQLNRYSYLISKFGQNGLYSKINKNLVVKDENNTDVEMSIVLVSNFLFGGLRRNEDGSFTRQDDYKSLMDELDKFTAIEDSNVYMAQIEKFIKDNDLISVQKEVDRIQKEFDETPEPTKEEVLNMQVSEIGTFENLKALTYFSKEMMEDYTLTIGTKGLYVDKHKEDVIMQADNENIEVLGDRECVILCNQGETLAQAMETAHNTFVKVEDQSAVVEEAQ